MKKISLLFSYCSSLLGPHNFLKTLSKEYEHQFPCTGKHFVLQRQHLLQYYTLLPCYTIHIQQITVTHVASALQVFKITQKVDI